MITVKQAKQVADLKGAWKKTAEIEFHIRDSSFHSRNNQRVAIASFHTETPGVIPAYFLEEMSVVEITHQEYAALLDNYTKQQVSDSHLDYWRGVDTSAIR
jgi:hypothetical protein